MMLDVFSILSLLGVPVLLVFAIIQLFFKKNEKKAGLFFKLSILSLFICVATFITSAISDGNKQEKEQKAADEAYHKTPEYKALAAKVEAKEKTAAEEKAKVEAKKKAEAKAAAAKKAAAKKLKELEKNKIAADMLALEEIYNGTAKIKKDEGDKAFLIVYNNEGYLQNLVNHAKAGNVVAYNMIQEDIQIAKNASLNISSDWKIRACTSYSSWTGEYSYQYQVQNGRKIPNN